MTFEVNVHYLYWQAFFMFRAEKCNGQVPSSSSSSASHKSIPSSVDVTIMESNRSDEHSTAMAERAIEELNLLISVPDILFGSTTRNGSPRKRNGSTTVFVRWGDVR